VDVTKLPEGINGMVGMGGNVWEWISDNRGGDSLTVGASWWYDSGKNKKNPGPNTNLLIFMQFMLALDVLLINKRL